MRIAKLSFFLLALVLLFFSCKTPLYTPKNYEKSQLRFGSGGGFAGTVSTYVLLDNGQLFFQAAGDSVYQALETVSETDCSALFAQAEELALSELKFSYPDNMYQFLEYHKDGKQNKIVWGANKKPLDKRIQAFYQKLNALATPEK